MACHTGSHLFLASRQNKIESRSSAPPTPHNHDSRQHRTVGVIAQSHLDRETPITRTTELTDICSLPQQPCNRHRERSNVHVKCEPKSSWIQHALTVTLYSGGAVDHDIPAMKWMIASVGANNLQSSRSCHIRHWSINRHALVIRIHTHSVTNDWWPSNFQAAIPTCFDVAANPKSMNAVSQ